MIAGCIGLNHRTCPVEIRERFSVARHKLASEGEKIHRLDSVGQCVLLSTCNRMEIYFWAEDSAAAFRDIIGRYLEADGVDGAGDHFYCLTGDEAVGHLCRVLSGLDSMVLGETEIFGQVKEAYRTALESGLTGREANKVFQHAFAVAKKVRRETGINTGATSVGSVAVDLAEQIFGRLEGAKVLILGAGEMSRLTARALRSRGAESVFVANRSYDRAVELAESVGGEAIGYDRWFEYLEDIDIVVASTSAPHYILNREMLLPLREKRRYRSLFLIDISVPRNIDPSVESIEEVYLYDIDTLQQLAEEARKSRELEIKRCEAIIREAFSTNSI